MARMNFVRSLSRRSVLAAAGAFFSRRIAAGKPDRPPRILLRSSWQSVNIGDIGHTPGALGLLQKHLPEAEITLWPGRLGHGSRELLTKNFPKLKIAEGTLDANNKPSTPELAKAWEEADLYLSRFRIGFPGRKSCSRVPPHHGQTGWRIWREYRPDLRYQQKIARPKAERSKNFARKLCACHRITSVLISATSSMNPHSFSAATPSPATT